MKSFTVLFLSLVCLSQASFAESGSVSYRSAQSLRVAQLEREVAQAELDVQTYADLVDFMMRNPERLAPGVLKSTIDLYAGVIAKHDNLLQKLESAENDSIPYTKVRRIAQIQKDLAKAQSDFQASNELLGWMIDHRDQVNTNSLSATIKLNARLMKKRDKLKQNLEKAQAK